MNELLTLPIILPFAGGAAAVFVKKSAVRSFRLAFTVAGLHTIAGSLLLYHVQTNGIFATQIGSWPAPFGITLVADRLSAVMVMITAVINLAVTSYSKADIGIDLIRRGHYCLLQILVGGICGAFLTGDVFNLYVWFEVMLMASFGLLVLGQSKTQLDGGVKYVTINLLSTLLFITGIGLLYGLTGTLNMADLHRKIPLIADQGLLTALAVLFLAAFGIKSALFPLFFWLPAAYHTPPVSVSAIFAGLLTKVGIYALIRFFTLVFVIDGAYLYILLMGVAALTMITGVLGAAAQNEFRRILSFHIISQVGYMVLGLSLQTRLALAGTIFYLVHHIIVKANLFLVSGVVKQLKGSFELAQLGGIYRSNGWIAALFFIPAFSLAGFPPLSGFWAKMILIRASLDVHQYWLALVAAVVGLLTVYSMTKIWGEVFWKPAPESKPTADPLPLGGSLAWMLVPVAVLAVLTVIIGLGAEFFVQFSLQAAEDLRHPERYVSAVMGI
ncbi:MAG: Na+/H+ antiporter subunit D [Deltaproteobacteria bacterium]|jgi:multicomponent Na+:H+ antiporter subunit D|nr:Na+/H+ antiporter subunit D [Deltaproteobacteria bacterium]